MMRETLDIFTADEDRVIVNLNALIDFFFLESVRNIKISPSAYNTTVWVQLVPKLIHTYLIFFYWGLDGGDGQPRLVQPKTHVPKPTVGYNLSHLFLDLTFMFASSFLKQGQAAK